jgi:hypothetical protein
MKVNMRDEPTIDKLSKASGIYPRTITTHARELVRMILQDEGEFSENRIIVA